MARACLWADTLVNNVRVPLRRHKASLTSYFAVQMTESVENMMACLRDTSLPLLEVEVCVTSKRWRM